MMHNRRKGPRPVTAATSRRRRRAKLLTVTTLAAGAANLAVVMGLSRPDETALAAQDSPPAAMPVDTTRRGLPQLSPLPTVLDQPSQSETSAPSPVETRPVPPATAQAAAAADASYYMVRVITFYGNDDGRGRAEAIRGFFESLGWHPVVARRTSGYWVVEVGRYPSWDGAEHTRRALRGVDHPQASFYTAIVLHRTVRR